MSSARARLPLKSTRWYSSTPVLMQSVVVFLLANAGAVVSFFGARGAPGSGGDAQLPLGLWPGAGGAVRCCAAQHKGACVHIACEAGAAAAVRKCGGTGKARAGQKLTAARVAEMGTTAGARAGIQAPLTQIGEPVCEAAQADSSDDDNAHQVWYVPRVPGGKLDKKPRVA